MVAELLDSVIFIKHLTSNMYWAYTHSVNDARRFWVCTHFSYEKYIHNPDIELQLDMTSIVRKHPNEPVEGFRIVRTQIDDSLCIPDTVTIMDPRGAILSLSTLSLLKMIHKDKISISNSRLIGKFVYAIDRQTWSLILKYASAK